MKIIINTVAYLAKADFQKDVITYNRVEGYNIIHKTILIYNIILYKRLDIIRFSFVIQEHVKFDRLILSCFNYLSSGLTKDRNLDLPTWS